VASRHAQIVTTCIARARRVHLVLLLGSVTLSLILLARWFDHRLEFERLNRDAISLAEVVDQAQLALTKLNASLIKYFVDQGGSNFEVKPLLTKVLIDTIRVQTLAQNVADRLVGDPALTIEETERVNIPLKPLREVFNPLAGMSFAFDYGTLTPPSDLEQLRFRQIIVFARFAQIDPGTWIKPLKELIDTPKDGLKQKVRELGDKLAAQDAAPQDLRRTDSALVLFQRLQDRAAALSAQDVGTLDSTFAATAAAAAQLRTQLKAEETRQTGERVKVPETGIEVTVAFVIYAAPFIVLAGFSTILFILGRALIAVRGSRRSDLEEQKLDWSYDPIAAGSSGEPCPACFALLTTVGWSATAIGFLILAQVLYEALGVHGDVAFFRSVNPWLILAAAVCAIFVHVVAYNLGHEIARLSRPPLSYLRD
jgi:hypothetical protein